MTKLPFLAATEVRSSGLQNADSRPCSPPEKLLDG